jgi:hypothetical protein
MITRSVEAKKTFQEKMQKKIGFGSKNRPESGKPKTNYLKTDRRSVFGFLKPIGFGFGLGFPQGSNSE